MYLSVKESNSFGYNNLVVDMRMFEQVREQGIRTIFDASSLLQLPGAGGDKSLLAIQLSLQF